MNSPVSAFAVYRSNKQSNYEKKKNKSKRITNSSKALPISPKALSKSPKVHSKPKPISEEVMKNAAQKLKKNKKKNESKNIIKKKTHKKKKSKNTKATKGDDEQPVMKRKIKRNRDDKHDSDDIPSLIPISFTNFHESNLDSVDSCSSNGSIDFEPVHTDSVEEGLKVFKWMIAPYNPEEFLNRVWEKKPLHIARNKPDYYKEIISTPIIDDMLRNESIQFTKNIDITSYVDNKRETHNPEGRALPHIVWDFYLNGCSIRLLNPQTYIPKLHLVNATMQEFFNSFVGANAYLTPPDSQGFAPHYDDIEAFILQTEGKKHWRIYKPLNENEILPRVSSKNFSQEDIGDPIMEVTLEAGDMLYFPRGYIHQGVTIDGEHSLHVTISMYQKHSWADLFEKMIPAALQMAINENVELRQGLPFDIYDNFGIVNSDLTTPRRKELELIIHNLFEKITQHLPLDDAVDQMHKNFQQDALPPVLNDMEKSVTVFGDTDVMIENGKVINRVEISLDTRIRLLRKNILRMVSEDKIKLYYYIENSLEYHGNEMPYLEVDEGLAPAIETLITSYPNYIAVENLEIPNDSDKLQLADALWSRGIIMTEFPLQNIDDD